MNGYPLPTFDYHEALLIGDFFLQDLLEVRNEPKPSDQEDLENLAEEFRKTPGFDKVHVSVREAIEHFAEFLNSVKLAGTFLHDVDKAALIRKLRELNESRRVQLYFAVARYFWTDGTESQAEGLCRAGLVDKQRVGTAKALERLDQRLREHAGQGIKFPLKS
jgi:phosphoribosylanthranilate isomerase